MERLELLVARPHGYDLDGARVVTFDTAGQFVYHLIDEPVLDIDSP